MSIQVCQRLQQANSVVIGNSVKAASLKSSQAASSYLKETGETVSESLKGLGILKNQDLLNVKGEIDIIGKRFKSLSDAVKNKQLNAKGLRQMLSEISSNARTINASLSKVALYLAKSEDKARQNAVREYEAKLKEFDTYLKRRAANGLSTEFEDDGSPILPPIIKIDKDEGRDANYRTTTLIGEYQAKYSKQIPSRMKQPVLDACVPLYVKFGNSRATVQRLRDIGLKVEPLSTINVGSSDIGLCLEDQTVLFFRQADADKYVESYLTTLEGDKRANATVIKNLQRKIRATRKEIDKIIELGRSLDRTTSRKELVQLTKDKRALESKIDSLDDQIKKLSVSDKQGKSVVNVVKKAETKTRDASVLKYAEHLLEMINLKSPIQYALVTGTFNHRLGTDKNIVAMWIMEKDRYLRLIDLATNGLNVKHWIWPWAM